MTLSRTARFPLTLLVCCSLVLPSCSTLNERFADDPTDVCRPERATLRSTGDFFAQDILAGAAIGAVSGGLIGGLAGGDVRSALFGALAGGALGAASGYWVARQRQFSDQAVLYQTVYGDIERENQSIDNTQLAFNRLVDCRNNEAAQIRVDLRAGRISREAASVEMAAVRARSDTDLRLARSISGHIQERSKDFSYASTQVASTQAAGTEADTFTTPARPVRGTRSLPTAAASQVQAASSTNLAKRDQFEQSITRAQSSQSAFELS